MPIKEIYKYGLGALSNSIINAFVSVYMLKFYVDLVGLSTESIVGIFIFFVLWGSFKDLMIGMVIDNTRHRSYLLYSPVPVIITSILCFNIPEVGQTMKLVYAIISYLAWGLSFTGHELTYWSLSSVCSQDIIRRSKVTSIARSFSVSGLLLVLVMTQPLYDLLGSYKKILFLYLLTFSLVTWIVYTATKEDTGSFKREKYTIKTLFRQIKSNHELRITWYAMLIVDGLIAFKFIYIFFYLEHALKIKELIGLMLGLNLFFIIMGSLLAPLLIKHVGKKQAAVIGIVVISITGIGMFLSGYVSIASIVIWQGLQAIACGITMIALHNMVLDCVDYGFCMTGIRGVGIIISLTAVKTRIAWFIGGLFCSLSLTWFDYTSVTIRVMNGMHSMFTIVPGVLTLLAVIPLLFYSLSNKRYLEIVAEINKVG